MVIQRPLEMRLFSVILAWPPSQNESLIPARGRGRFIKSKVARDWFALAKAACAKAHGIGSLFPIEDVAVHITLCPAVRTRGDIDNGVKKVLDAMAHEAYHDDRQIRSLAVRFLELPKDGEACIMVNVWHYRAAYIKEVEAFLASL